MSDMKKYEVMHPGPDGEVQTAIIEAQYIWIDPGGVLSFGVDGPEGNHRARIFAPGTWSHVRIVE